MKKLLITGKNSYIGTSFQKWIRKYEDQYIVETISVRGESWKMESFSGYDVIFHVAGIAHSDKGKANNDTIQKYYEVNTDLTIKLAQKAKADGVKQFIFMSSIIVYGEGGSVGKGRIITRDTKPAPTNYYGDSKLKADQGIQRLRTEQFRVVSVRPPMIYGINCKGNYVKLSKLARKCPVFPNIENQRSMLHIENLCEFVRFMIENEESGIYYPQNREYVSTIEMVKRIAEVYGRRICFTKIFNPGIVLLASKIGILNKVFGNMVYDKELSRYKWCYWINDLERSIELTEDRRK